MIKVPQKIKPSKMVAVAAMLGLMLSTTNCASQSDLKRLTNIETPCVQYSADERNQRFVQVGFEPDRYLSRQIRNDRVLYAMAIETLGSLSEETLRVIMEIDEFWRSSPGNVEGKDSLGNKVVHRADRFVIKVGPIEQPVQKPVQPHSSNVEFSYNLAMTYASKDPATGFGVPYQVVIADNTTSILPSQSIHANMEALLHELGHVVHFVWEEKKHRRFFAGAENTYANLKKRFDASKELQSQITGHTASAEAELIANAFHSSRCSPDTYLVARELIPEAMKAVNKQFPVPQWRHKARRLAMPGIEKRSNKSVLRLAMAPNAKKVKICEGKELECASGLAKTHSLQQPDPGMPWGVQVMDLPENRSDLKGAQKVFTIFVQDGDGHDYFYTFDLLRKR